ncbi:trypsin-like [Symsagittifera roscoffensis]|uniref:trypsin-like n=1 Tax=Symsagittifera roscoffensis TaxID=84072 RepID=UPI00307C1E0A
MVKAFALFISLTMINITQLRQYFLSLALLQFLHVCAIPSGLNRNLSNLNSTGHIDSLIVNGERSVDRSFFVKVITLEVATFTYVDFCGGFIHSSRAWIITAAHCVYDYGPEAVIVEYRDFSSPTTYKHLYSVNRIRIAPGFSWYTRYNNLALLRLYHKIEARHFFHLPLCSEEQPHGTRMGTCGLGSTSTGVHEYPEVLMETYFREAKFLTSGLLSFDWCREDNVCGTPIVQGSNICAMDEGGPLFLTYCDSSVPTCLYGIGSFFTNRDGSEFFRCNGHSVFTNIPKMKSWIEQTTEVFS